MAKNKDLFAPPTDEEMFAPPTEAEVPNKTSLPKAIGLGLASGVTSAQAPALEASITDPKYRASRQEQYVRENVNKGFPEGARSAITPPTGEEETKDEALSKYMADVFAQKGEKYAKAQEDRPVAFGISDVAAGTARDIALTAGAGALAGPAGMAVTDIGLGMMEGNLRAPEGQKLQGTSIGGFLSAIPVSISAVRKYGAKGARALTKTKPGRWITGITQDAQERFLTRPKEVLAAGKKTIHSISKRALDTFNMARAYSKKLSGVSRRILSEDGAPIPTKILTDRMLEPWNYIKAQGEHVVGKADQIQRQILKYTLGAEKMADGAGRVDAGYLKTLIKEFRGLGEKARELYGSKATAAIVYENVANNMSDLAKDSSSLYKLYMAKELAPLTRELAKGAKLKTTDNIASAANKYMKGEMSDSVEGIMALDKASKGTLLEELKDGMAHEVLYGKSPEIIGSAKGSLVAKASVQSMAGGGEMAQKAGIIATALIFAKKQFARPVGRRVLEKEAVQKLAKQGANKWDEVAKALKLNPNHFGPQKASLIKMSGNPIVRHSMLYVLDDTYRAAVDKLEELDDSVKKVKTSIR